MLALAPTRLAVAWVVTSALMLRLQVEGDGISYFSYLPALFRGSVDLGPVYADFLRAGTPVYAGQLGLMTPLGLHANQFPVGPAMLALPAYALARLGALLTSTSAPPTWGPGLAVFCLVSAATLLAGLCLAYRLAARFTSPAAALGSVLLVWLAGALLFYGTVAASYAHTFSFFAAALFMTAALALTDRTRWPGWLAVGAAAGLMATTRWQDLVIAVIALAQVWRFRGGVAVVAGRLLALAVGGLVLLAPQLLVTHALFGYWLPRPYPGMTFAPLHPHLSLILFSSHNGLFTWNPVLLPALAGLVLMLRSHPWVAGPLLAAFLLELWVSAASSEWWQGNSFGGRRLISAYPALMVGGAYLLDRAWRWRQAAWALGAALVAWNVVLVAQKRYLLLGDLDPGYRGLLGGQLRAVARVPRLFGGDTVRMIGEGLLHVRALEAAGGFGLLAAMVVFGVVVVISLGRSTPVASGPAPLAS